jgi:hypothetical protein
MMQNWPYLGVVPLDGCALHTKGDGCISAATPGVPVLVIPSDGERLIARYAMRVLRSDLGVMSRGNNGHAPDDHLD